MAAQKPTPLRLQSQDSLESLRELPYHYKELNMQEQMLTSIKNQDEVLLEYLSQQKQDYRQYVKQKRLFVIKNRKDELFKQRQSMSYGQPKHSTEFKRATQAQEFFQREKPILKFPLDTVLNTFDNSKRFLKELELSKEETKLKRMELRQNNYKHYKGDAWNYIKVDSDYFGEFQLYKLAPEVHEDKKAKYAQIGPYVLPPSTYPTLFQSPPADGVHIMIPSNPIHSVKYRPAEIKPDPFKTSKLNDMQKVKPFTPATTHGQFFQKDYLKSTFKSGVTTMESTIPGNKRSGVQRINADGQSFLGRNSSPNRSTTPRGNSRATSPT